MASRNFDAGKEERTPHAFTVAGQTFVAKPALSWPALSKMVSALSQQESETETALKVNDFFDVCLMKADRARFKVLLMDEDDSDDPVSMDQIMEIVSWLLEQYTGKAGGQSDSSSPGLPETAASSSDEPSLQATGTDSNGYPPRVVRL